MKRAISILACALFAAALAGAAEPEGFGDLRWGDQAPKRWKLTKNGESQICSRPSRGATFGSAPLERVEYEFVSDRLVGVALFVKDHAGFLAAKKEIEASFGTTGLLAPASPASESYHWDGKVVYADIYFLCEGVSPVIILSWAPDSGMPGAPVTPVKERKLQDQLRLCAQLATALDKTIVAWEKRAEAYAASGRIPGGVCESRTERVQEEDIQKITQDERTALSKSQVAISERVRLQKEMDRLQAELDALRAKRLAATQSTPPPIS